MDQERFTAAINAGAENTQILLGSTINGRTWLDLLAEQAATGNQKAVDALVQTTANYLTIRAANPSDVAAIAAAAHPDFPTQDECNEKLKDAAAMVFNPDIHVTQAFVAAVKQHPIKKL